VQSIVLANQLQAVILSEEKNLVLRVPTLGLYNAKRILYDEILLFAQNDKVKVALKSEDCAHFIQEPNVRNHNNFGGTWRFGGEEKRSTVVDISSKQ
jgi:hypothetical protein